jgi:hypothetical protein
MTRLLPLLLAACAPKVDVDDTGAPGGGGSALGPTAVLATVSDDYAVGALATVAVDDWSVADTLTDISGDPAVVSSGGYVFQLDRYTYDVVKVYTPGAWSAPLTEFALQDLANPHDVAVCDGLAFVAQHDATTLAVHDPTSGLLAGTVDLSAYADADGVPEASTLVATADGMLYAGLLHLDREGDWTATGGAVVEVDCAARTVTRSWALHGPRVLPDPEHTDQVLILEEGVGIHRLDPTSGATTLLVEEVVERGTFGGIAAAGGRAIVTTVTDDYAFGIGCVDLDAGTFDLLEAASSYLISVDASPTGEAWISARAHWSDPTSPQGVRVFDIATCTERTDRPIETLLAPMDIAFY